MLKNQRQIFILLILGSFIFNISCVQRKKLVYFQEQKKDEKRDEFVNIRPEKKIQPFDNIYVNKFKL